MGNLKKQTFPVLNMHCAGCANNVEKTVRKLVGVADASVNFASNTLSVSYETDKLTPGEIRAAVLAAGYDLIMEEEHVEERQEEEQQKRYHRLKTRVIGAWILAVPLLLLSMVFMHVPYSNEIQMVLAIPVLVLFGTPFYTGAWKQARLGRSNMDTLVALGAGASFGYSTYALFAMTGAQVRGDMDAVMGYMHEFYFESAAMILTLITVGKMLESHAKGKTTDALKSLMRLAPKTATVVRDGKEVIVSITEVRQGDTFVVRPGENIPVDGIVLEGSSAVNEAALTGESIPVDKQKGSSVSAATTNQSGFLRCEATRVGEDTTLSEVHDGLMALGADVLRETLEALSDGTLVRVPQTGASNYAPMLDKETGHIDWQQPAKKIHDLVRGLDAWPGAYTFLGGKKYKIWKTRCTGEKAAATPGTILAADRRIGLRVAAGDEVLEIVELQAPGKKRMTAAEYLNGHPFQLPVRFEEH